MQRRRIVLTLSFALSGACLASAGDPARIAKVVDALNARAVQTIEAAVAEDGSTPESAGLPVAWTVLNPLAGGGGCAIDVAVLGADSLANVTNVVGNITGDPRITTVTGIVTTGVTPTLVELQAFDAVIYFTNLTPQDSITLGNNLADYVDAGGGVVVAIFGIRASVVERTVNGRFLTDNYYCIEQSIGATTTGLASLGTVYVPGSHMMTGVTTFSGGTSSFRSPAPLNPNATRIADWSTGQILIAERTDLLGGRVDVNMFAVSTPASATSWDPATSDGEVILRNALVVASGCLPPIAAVGACCFTDGTCLANQSATDCANAGGTYRGDGTNCTPNLCPQPGACCFGDGTCQLLLAGDCATAGGTYRGDATTCAACDGGCCLPTNVCIITNSGDCAAQSGAFRGFGSNCAIPCACFEETEDNNTKAAANDVQQPLMDGDCISGTTTGSSTITPGSASADYFKVNIATRPLGIYRHRLEYLSDTPANTATIRGLTQTAGVPNAGTDAASQTSSTLTTPPRYVQWYGFGKGEMFYFRVTGLATTTAPYVYSLTTQTETATDIGTYFAGNITLTTIGQGHSSDTELWVYDANLDAITDYGNDDESIAGGGTGATAQSLLTRSYAPGVYYIALSNFNVQNHLGNPADDDARTDPVLDFPNMVVNSSTTINLNCAFAITDSAGTTQHAATKLSHFDVLWFKFTVQPPPAVGACCFADGSCTDGQTATACANAGGTYAGDGTNCTPNNCPQPGACCFDDGTCQLLQGSACATAGGTFRGEGTPCTACDGGCCLPDDSCVVTTNAGCATQGGSFRGFGSDCALPCGCFSETEGNDTKAAANDVQPPLMDGDCIIGTTTGSSTITPGLASADYFKVNVATRPLGIYQHRLEYQSDTPSHIATIRGLSQTAGVPNAGTDAIAQTATTATSPPRYVQWYGFGKGEMLYFRVTGVATSTAPYIYTLSTQGVTATDIGTFNAGNITITTIGQGHSTDTDLWVYDENLNAITNYGNDDESIAGGGTGATLQSLLTRSYAPGVYYLALSNFSFTSNQPAPADDDFRTGVLLDFPDAALNSSTTTNVNCTFSIIDNVGAVQVPATRASQFDVLWFKFTVQIPPAFGACCFDNGSCTENQTATDCATAGGVYQGDGSDCSPNPCPQPGACCLDPAPCQILSLAQCNNAGGQFLGANSLCSLCDCYVEVEPNDTKPTANNTPALADGDCIRGVSTGLSGVEVDYYKVSVATRPLGIYRHRLEYSSTTPFNSSTLRGLTQTAGVPNAGTDVAFQTASTTTAPIRGIQWYGFGKGEMLYFRVTGTTTSTAEYVYQLSTQAVTATDVGSYAAGTITISTVGQTTVDTDLWVYDGNLNAIPDYGNDEQFGTTSVQSVLTRTYAPGTYYLAISDFNLANNLGSPPDDDFRTGSVMDFPDILAESDSNAAGQNLSFTITDANGTTPVAAATTEGGFDVLWFKFTVASPCPGARGDANCDGSVDFFDIDPFLQSLFDPAGYLATYCGGSFCAADADCSGGVDFFDIDPFLDCLFNGCLPIPPDCLP